MIWLVRMDIEATIAENEKIRDSYGWHKKLWECFPNFPEKSRIEIGFLHRVDVLDGIFRIWLLSREKPVAPNWCLSENFAIKEIAPNFLTNRHYAFDLKANPVKTIARRDSNGKQLYRANGKRMPGKRVPLVKPDELSNWLMKKGKTRCRNQNTGEDVPGGFRIFKDHPLEISPMVESHFRKKNKSRAQDHVAFHGGVQFRGILEVTNAEWFRETYYSGIGSAKSFGFGLLLIAPVNL